MGSQRTQHPQHQAQIVRVEGRDSEDGEQFGSGDAVQILGGAVQDNGGEQDDFAHDNRNGRVPPTPNKVVRGVHFAGGGRGEKLARFPLQSLQSIK